MNNPIIWLRGDSWRANSYVVGNILFDAGVSVESVLPYKEQIDTIVLTHGHIDHTANVAEIAKICSATVFIGKYDLPLFTEAGLSLSNHFGEQTPNCPAETLEDGDVVGEFVVYYTPGHTHGSISLFRESDGALISGDTIFPNGSFGRCDLPTGNYAELVCSINRLAELPVRSLWCGHGIPVVKDAKRHVLLSQYEVPRYG